MAGAPFSTHIERMACKVVESCIESIPTMLLQLYQVFLTGVWSKVAVVSIVISYIVTASKASMIAVDLDRNLQQRAYPPKFYGYVLMRRAAGGLRKLSCSSSASRTSFSLETGPKFVQFRFMDSGATDEQRCSVLMCNPRMWRPIQDSITEWIERSWAKWKQDPPEWFTAEWIAAIPDDMIPKSFANILSSQPPLGPAGKPKRGSSIKAKKSGSIILLSSTLPGLEVPSSSDPMPGTVVCPT